jgi:hypothetical protein
MPFDRRGILSTLALLAVLVLAAGVGLMLGWYAIMAIARWGSL